MGTYRCACRGSIASVCFGADTLLQHETIQEITSHSYVFVVCVVVTLGKSGINRELLPVLLGVS